MKIGNGDILKRNGNYFIVKHDKNGHYYVALLFGDARITSWHRTPLKKLKSQYEQVENYAGESIVKKWNI